MKDPERWLKSDDADPEIAALLRAARPSRPMSREERMRTAQRVAHLAAIPVAASTLLWFKGIALAALIGAGSGVAFVGVVELAPMELSPNRQAPPRFTPTLVLSPAPIQPPASGFSAVVPPAPEPRASTAPVPPTSSTDTLAQEAALLEQARASAGSNPSAALKILGEHRTRFPRTTLGMEREFLHIVVLDRLGRHGEARARAESLLQSSPGSLYEQRLRKMFPEE